MADTRIPQINFQPWRQQKRVEALQQFSVYAVIVVAVGALAVFLGGSVVDVAINAQKSRNAQINSEIKVLERKLAEIKNLQKDREDMIERMKIIQDLQGNRPVSVRVFDELVRVLPDTVFFESLSMKGSQLFVKGIAESNTEVSELMRQLDASAWFANPNLTAIKANRKYGEFASEFQLSFTVNLATNTDELETGL